MSRTRMSAADAAWLRMDRPTNLMVVTSVMWFDEPLDWHAVRDLVATRVIARFPRFSQRTVEAHGLFWEDVDDFDLESHLHAVRLPEPGDQESLEGFTSSLVGVPLPRNRPLWDLYLVDNYQGGCAMVFRMHHAIADGTALARLLLSLTEDAEEDPVEVEAPGTRSRSSLTAGLRAGLDLALHPGRLAAYADPGHLVDLARTAAMDAAALTKLALLPADPPTALRGTVGVTKQVVWSRPLALSELRTAGHHAQSTVNDILLAAVAGALRTHLVRSRSPVHDIRAIVPLSLRSPDLALPVELGNMFGLVYLPLPLTTARREDRLREMTRRTTAVKNSAQGEMSYAMLEMVGMSPGAVEEVAIDVFASKGTGVMTNVPGPRRPVTLAGQPMAGTIGWGPTSGDLALGVALFSYAGTVTIGLCVDTGIVPDARTMLDDILFELVELLSRHPAE
ncbi:wax ester/triacylglycerol synthase family O-acyltransferase [Nocardioides sp.]|uniref:wax ester/triacylglycerol synthase family O-acyltransferase n=1 Tax=Nocardioides sp. TaxID=35761 RepID=UPI003D144CD0